MAHYRSQTFKVASYRVRKRADGKGMGDAAGRLGLGISGDQSRASVLALALEATSFGWTPRATEGPAAREREVATEREPVSESGTQES